MIERSYPVTPGGQPTGQDQGGTPQRSAATYDTHPGVSRRGSIPPSDMPQPGAGRPSGVFRGPGYVWDPSGSPDDPHDADYSVDDDGGGDFDDGGDDGSVPDNIVVD